MKKDVFRFKVFVVSWAKSWADNLLRVKMVGTLISAKRKAELESLIKDCQDANERLAGFLRVCQDEIEKD